MGQRYFITGDTHRDFDRVVEWVMKENKGSESTLIILGDAGINFSLDLRDKNIKKLLNNLNIKLFCIHGNHEERPENIEGYEEIEYNEGTVFVEKMYPNLLFAKDGETYNFGGKKCLVIGGAYSIDKQYRIRNFLNWFPSEQISEVRRKEILEETKGKVYDYVFTHTCPYSIRPTHLFIKNVNQDNVDTSMERFLEDIANQITFDKWYFGHFHGDWVNGKYKMLYKNIEELR